MIILLNYGLPAYAKSTILILGDSLSAGYGLKSNESWVDLLDAKLKKDYANYRVVNASVAGASTADGLSTLPKMLEKYQPQIVIVALGSNDGLRGNPIAIMQQNLTQIITISQAKKAKVLLVGFQMPSNYGKQYTTQFAQVFIDLSKKFQVPLVPFMLEGFATDLSYFQADKLHPNAAAQTKILAIIWPYLQKMLSS